MKLWTSRVHEMHGGVCAICGKRHGEDNGNGKPTYLNAHHIEPRATCARLRYDPLNGILLCPSCHKFGRNSAHKGSIWFITWLMTNRPLQYAYVLEKRDEQVDINDRGYLDSVEKLLSDPCTEESMEAVRTRRENEGEGV